jgi:hypothetical protein
VLGSRRQNGANPGRMGRGKIRGTCATPLLAGVHPKVVQERVGRLAITAALDLHSLVTATIQEDAAARIDAAFRSAKMGSKRRR